MTTRRLRPTSPTSAKIYSASREGKAVEHVVSVDIQAGTVSCSCESFRYDKGRKDGSIHNVNSWCKHIVKELMLMKRNGVI